jgi:hypothetical protein
VELRRASSVAAGSNRRVRTVVSGEIINPLTDAEKLKKKFVTAAGDPKRAKVDLQPTDEVRVIQFELYQRDHACQMCGGEQKSQRVLLLENLRTGERFHAAGDCLRFHFGLEIAAFYRAAGLYSRVLEKLSVLVGIEHEAGASQAIVTAALVRLERLGRYQAAAVSGARELLERIERQPSSAASGQLDAALRELEALIDLQADFVADPERFEDRWRALDGHPRSDRLTGEQREAVQRAIHDRRTLHMEDHLRLVEALDSVRRSTVVLRAVSIQPWDYPDRASYQAALRRWAESQPFNESRPRSYVVTSNSDQQKLGERLQRSLTERGGRRPATFWLTALEPSQLERMGALPNEDTLVDRGAQITRTQIVKFLLNPDDPTSRRVRQGVCIFYFDRWYEAYEYWYRWRERGGRAALEALDPLRIADADSSAQADEDLGASACTEQAEDATAIADEALRALPAFLRSVLGVEPTEEQLEALRKPWIMACIAADQGDTRGAAAAEVSLAKALEHLGLGVRRVVE